MLRNRLGKLVAAMSAGIVALPLLCAPALAQSFIRDAEVEQTIARLSTPIFKAAGIDPTSIDMFLLNSRDLNAFVFAGNNMVLHTGLITRLETPEGLIGVIAHETGHITGNHLARRQVAQENLRGPAAAGVLLSILAGAASGNAGVAAGGLLGSGGTAQRLLLAFNRAEEAAADQAGATYLERSGIDPAGLMETLKIFKGQEIFAAGRLDPYARTHPLSSERLNLLQQRIQNTTAPGGKVDAETKYWFDRMRAKLIAFLDQPNRTLRQLDENDESEITLMKRAIALHRLPAPDEALATMDKLIALRPEDPYYWELKGQILFESGRAAAAVDPLRKAVALAPQEPLITGALGRALLSLNDPALDAEALTALEKGARGRPEVVILRDLATAYARAGREGEAALATAERFMLQGGMRDSLRHANHALEKLPTGSPGWFKADDIRTTAERALNGKG
ncbi:MAG: M48 family metalloprotease [Pikeienuella sp.]